MSEPAPSSADEAVYDAAYYLTGYGPVPYRRTEPVWQRHFGRLADAIVARLAPRRVLDVGCGPGLLVEALRDRGVEAYGLDRSAWAISQVREDLRSFCREGDVRALPGPFAGEAFDLAVCLEVLEHLSPAAGERAIHGLSALAPRLLFSSTPDEFEDPTHQSVRPPDEWVERFAAAGLHPVVDVDLSPWIPHAMLLARDGAGDARVRGLYADWVARAAEVAALRRSLDRVRLALLERQAAPEAMPGARSTRERALALVARARERWLPEGTRRRQVVRVSTRLLRYGSTHLPSAFLPAARVESFGAGPAPRLLVIRGCGGDSGRYRCDHLLEALRLQGGSGLILEADAPGLAAAAPALAEAADALVLQRAPLGPGTRALLAAARRRGRPVLFETDDLLFDPTLDLDAVPGLRRLVPGDLPGRLLETLRASDAALVSTPFLAERVAALGHPAHVLRNGFSAEMLALAAPWVPCTHPTGVAVLGYASGSPTHDRDFAQALPALVELCGARADVELALVGPLSVDPALARLGARLRTSGFVPWRSLPGVLASFDIDLAPLDLASPFAQAKSEVKVLEAALVGVPTVASPIGAYVDAIAHGEDGLLARSEPEWREALTALVADPALRRRMGLRARAKVLAGWSLARRGEELRAILAQVGVAGAAARA